MTSEFPKIPDFPELAELRGLLDALCEESISVEQVRRLEELVLTRPEAEAFYVQYMSLYADISRHFAVLPSPTEASLRGRVQAAAEKREGETARQGDRGSKPGGTRFSLPVSLSGRLLVAASVSALAAGLLLAVALWPRSRNEPRLPEQASEPTDNTVAVLVWAHKAEWEETDLPTRAGAPLPPGHLRLKAGLAQIEFYSGASVILEGPAHLQILSANAAFCERGKLRATVPPQAQGFTVRTPKLDLVDRGTEFGLQVGAGNKTEVHVFQGKVELHDADTNTRTRRERTHKELTTGQGVRLDGPGPLHSIKPDPDAFRTVEYLEARLAEETAQRQRAWLASSAAVRRDPSLLVYYTFQAEQERSRTLLDQANNRKKSPHNGAIVGCRWATGRWPGRKALEFKQVSDRVRFHVPGEFDSLTLMAWVRVDALPNGNNSLMMADGWEPGGCHWQIGDNGMLILGVQQRPKGKGGHYHAPGVFTPRRFGQWVHLAVVYDRDAAQVTHYVDGRPVTREPLLFDLPLRIGDGELGNWNIAAHRNRSPIRYFSGCMDEFLLFGRALREDEIERLYTQGQPPS
jgi:hypothetical protein